MSQKKQGKATKKPVVDPKRSKANPKLSTRAWAVNSGLVVSSVLVTVAQCSTLPGIQHAAQAVSTVFSTIERVHANKEDFQIIADDASELIIAIWRLQEKSENPKKWTSPEIRDMVGNLKTALENVNKIANRQATRNVAVRVIFNMTDAGKIRQTREMIVTAVSKFQVLSHIKMNELLLEVAAKQKEMAQDVKDLKVDKPAQEEEAEAEAEESQQPPPALVGPNSAAIRGFSISNGSGYMYNSNIGNVVNNNISNVGNNNSRNYYG